MKKIMFLVIASLVFISGCGNKAEEVKMPSEFEEMTMEIETMPVEGVVRGTEIQPKNTATELPQPV
ncbi:MAG: hypothetical protein Q8R48_03650, partial [Candidatus Omnitrophota bacterium]|nr:hypothetical protein [Candidatus Omnitrophota bacterium]